MKRSRVRSMLMLFAGSVAAAVVFLFVLSFSASRPKNLGVTNGRLAPVPESPNCVSSQTDSSLHKCRPIETDIDLDDAMMIMQRVIQDQPRTTIVEADGLYLCAEFTSRIFRFVDDVEFLADKTAGVIHVRSASRVGHSDLGANRERVERIRTAFHAAVADAVN